LEINEVETKPFFQHAPNSNGETVMHEEVIHGIHGSFANRAKSTIWSPTFLKPPYRPKPVLESKPSGEFDLWRCPNFPKNFLHVRGDGA
jgi:hypothetical protein